MKVYIILRCFLMLHLKMAWFLSLALVCLVHQEIRSSLQPLLFSGSLRSSTWSWITDSLVFGVSPPSVWRTIYKDPTRPRIEKTWVSEQLLGGHRLWLCYWPQADSLCWTSRAALPGEQLTNADLHALQGSSGWQLHSPEPSSCAWRSGCEFGLEAGMVKSFVEHNVSGCGLGFCVPIRFTVKPHPHCNPIKRWGLVEVAISWRWGFLRTGLVPCLVER